MTDYICITCYDNYVQPERRKLGYKICLPCGDVQAKARVRTVAPINKSNYMLITDINDLKTLNPKRTT